MRVKVEGGQRDGGSKVKPYQIIISEGQQQGETKNSLSERKMCDENKNRNDECIDVGDDDDDDDGRYEGGERKGETEVDDNVNTGDDSGDDDDDEDGDDDEGGRKRRQTEDTKDTCTDPDDDDDGGGREGTEEGDYGEEGHDSLVAPDGGWGWLVVLGSFITTMVLPLLGIGFGVIFSRYLLGEGSSSTMSAWIFNTHCFIWNVMGILNRPLASVLGWRNVAMAGALVAFVAVILSAFTPSPQFLFFSFSLLGGIGGGVVVCMSFVIVPMYFHRRRGLANAIMMAGVCAGQIIGVPLIRLLQDEYGFKGATLVLSAIILNGCVGAAFFHPVEWHLKPRKGPGLRKQEEGASPLIPRSMTRGEGQGDRGGIKEEEEAIWVSSASLVTAGRETGQITQFSRAFPPYDVMSGSKLSISSAGTKEGGRGGEGKRGGRSGDRKRGVRGDDRKSSERGEGRGGREDERKRGGIGDDRKSGGRESDEGKSVGGRSGERKNGERGEGKRSGRDDDEGKNGEGGEGKRGGRSAEGRKGGRGGTEGKRRGRKGDEGKNQFIQVLRSTLSDLSILRSPRAIIISLGCMFFINSYYNFIMMVPFAMQADDHSLEDAAWCISASAICNMGGRILISALSDCTWFNMRLAYMSGLATTATTVLVFPLVHEVWLLVVVMAGWGLGIGTTMGLYNLIMVRFMGVNNLSPVFGASSLAVALGFLSVGPAVGTIRDVSNSYAAGMWFLSGLTYISFVLWLFMPAAQAYDRRRKAREHQEDPTSELQPSR